MGAFIEKLARILNIPVGLMFLLVAFLGGFLSYEPYYRSQDAMINFGAWGGAYVFLWFVYGKKFWMSPKKFDENID